MADDVIAQVSNAADVSWKRVEHVMTAGNPIESDERYTDWASTYDEDLAALKSNGNLYCARGMMKFIANSKTSKLLDVAAGTGGTGAALRDEGYRGIMDAIDLNNAMLKRAKEKNIYRNLTQFRVTPDVDLPVANDTYDAVICAGSLAADQVHEESILPMLRALKPGGILAFTTRDVEDRASYKARVEKIISDAEAENMMKKIEEIEYFAYEGIPGPNSDLKARIYVCQKK